jgi:hypothetical protein
MTLRTGRDPETGVPVGEIAETAGGAEQASLAGIWKCPNCGAQVQVIVSSDRTPVQPFTCVCATPMVAGEEH